jgi:Mg-chelatase subunit ChlD
MAGEDLETIVIDTQSLARRSPRMRELARAIGGRYHHIDHLQAQNVLAFVNH